MRIGELARRAGVTPQTIRYYEGLGVLPHPLRSPNGYREYPPDSVDLVFFIRDAQATGLTLTEVASILELRHPGESTCEHVLGLLDDHLHDLEQHIETLRRIHGRLLDLSKRGRGLDRAECTDPHRCRTIAGSRSVRATRKQVARRSPAP